MGLGGLHLTDGLLEPARREDGQQPPVDGGQHVGLAQVDVAGVADVAGQDVFPGVAAPVVGRPVAVLALHPAPAVPAVQPPAQDVGVHDALVGFSAGAAGSPAVGHDGLGGLEVVGGDQRLVGDGVGPDPAAGLVPAHPGSAMPGRKGGPGIRARACWPAETGEMRRAAGLAGARPPRVTCEVSLRCPLS